MQQLDFYKKKGIFTALEKNNENVRYLPNDINQLVQIIQGLVIHMFAAESFYNFKVPEDRLDYEANIRFADKLIDRILELNNTSLLNKRPPKERIIGVCHHFSKLLVAFLRHKNIPARMRYGFGGYFNEGYFEDHSVCEYWDSAQKKWIFVDPQFDEVWIKNLRITHNVLDVPGDKFYTSANSWILCRKGDLNPDKFGIFEPEMRGLWFIAGNLVKDIAALNKMELLQWDAWSGMPRPNNKMINKKTLAFFDSLADLAQEPDNNFEKLHQLYIKSSISIRVPDRVFNAMHRHLEWIDDSRRKNVNITLN